MRINHCCYNVFMPKEFLDGTNIVPGLQQMGRKGVSEGMGTAVFSNTGFAQRLFDGSGQN